MAKFHGTISEEDVELFGTPLTAILCSALVVTCVLLICNVWKASNQGCSEIKCVVDLLEKSSSLKHRQKLTLKMSSFYLLEKRILWKYLKHISFKRTNVIIKKELF